MDTRFIEVCIGLALVFALTSLLVTTVTEIWSSARGRRGANLELALRSMLADDPGQGGWHALLQRRPPSAFTQALINHPLMVSQSQGESGEQGRPSYLPGDLVVSVLLDLLGSGGTSTGRAQTPRLMLAGLEVGTGSGPKPPPELVDSLRTLAQGVEGDWSAYERRLVAWFDSIGERSGGWYKRWSQIRMALFGILIAALFNINPVVIASRLWNEEPLRRATVAAAESASATFAASQASASASEDALKKILERMASAAPAATPSATSAATQAGATVQAPFDTAAAARVESKLNGLRAELQSAQRKEGGSLERLDRLARMAVQETELREFIRQRRSSIAGADLPRSILSSSAFVEEKLGDIGALAAQSRLAEVQRAVREASIALVIERGDLLLQALPSTSGQRCRAALDAQARALCERIEGVRALGDGGLPVGWNWANLPGCEAERCSAQQEGARSRDQVRDTLAGQIAQADRNAVQRAAESCRSEPGKPSPVNCEVSALMERLSAERARVDQELTEAWRAASQALVAPPTRAGTVFMRCASGDVPCSWTLMAMGWLVIGLASVLGAPFWFDMLGKLIQLRGSGARPADEAKKGSAIPSQVASSGPGSGMLAPSTNLQAPDALNAGSSSALSDAERMLTADQIERIQKDGLLMPQALVTQRLDTDTRKRIAQWQDQQQQTPADGVLTGPQIDRLLRGTAPPPAPPALPVAPTALGLTPVRSDGTIAPLTEQEIRDLYGDIATVPAAAAGTVRVVAEGKPGGAQRELVEVEAPLPLAPRFANMKIHKRVRPHLKAVLQEILDEDLADRILTCDGTVVERHISWNAANRLSSHTWGIALDINCRHNEQGKVPAAIGEEGSVRELVPIFNKHGFAWGGHFRNGGPDGMHFELALRNPDVST